MRKLQKTAAGIPTVSQDTMLNIHDEARSRKMFSINMAWKEMMDRRRMVIVIICFFTDKCGPKSRLLH